MIRHTRSLPPTSKVVCEYSSSHSNLWQHRRRFFLYCMEVQKHQAQIFLLVGIQLMFLVEIGSCNTLLSSSEGGKCKSSLEKYITEPYFEEHDSLIDSDFQNFIANKLPLCSYGMLKDELNLMLRLSVLHRYLIGEGSHRQLSSSIGLSIQPESLVELPGHLCKIIIAERLPSGIFADPFELQHLLQRGVFTDAAVFGDTNLELPTVVSNRSVVEVHIDIGHNILSGHNTGMEINIELPLHARYPPLGQHGFSRVKFGGPDLFVKCNIQGKSQNHSCLFMQTGSVSESQTGIVWEIPRGIKEHYGLVSVVTFIFAVVSALLIVLTSICYSDI